MIEHASPRTRLRFRSLVAALVVAVAAAGAGTVAATAIGSAGIHGPVTVDEPAERIPYIPSGDGILFPINPLPRCLLVNGFGGYSGVNGAGGHQGVDIGADLGQEVYAVVDGVLQAQLDNTGAAGWGWKLLSHPDAGGVRDQYRYYHLDSFAEGLEVGDWVSAGDVIGYVGDTGNATPGGWHLHFEVRPGPQPERFGSAAAVDPLPLLDIPSTCSNYLD
jgi:murein DD-endopeptidase MepM/ murein hydrolase activator NlpD